MKVLAPDTLEPFELPGHHVVRYPADQPVPPEHRDAEVLLVWGQPREQVERDVADLPRLRLVQSVPAGAEPVLGLPVPASVAVATGAGLHGEMVAEHAVALVLTLVRRLPQASAAQREHRWASELDGPRPPRGHGPATETLRGAHVVLWGMGDIGQHLARLLAPFGARVTGVARHPGERDGTTVVDDVDPLLPDCDVLVMSLPGGDATRHALDERRIRLLRPGATFVVNVGRGSAIDEVALVAALVDGHLAGAGLDVTDPEPPAPDSPVWDAPRLVLTPHSAGGRPVGLPELLAHQLAHLDDGELRNPLAR